MEQSRYLAWLPLVKRCSNMLACRFQHCLTDIHWTAVKQILDADWASYPDDRKSIAGFCNFLGPSLIYWCAKKQSTVSRSSAEAKYQALASTAAELSWLLVLLRELNVCVTQVTHLLGVLGFGALCFLLGARPQDIPYVYCLFFVTFVPLRWMYYRYKKWHYFLLDFCYYANTIFLVMLLLYPKNERLFMVCFSFAEGPLAWALIVWRCSLVFSSVDKIVSVLIHLLPGIVFFIIRWWDPETMAAMHLEGKASGRASWPYVEDQTYLWKWLFVVPLAAYSLWQFLYFLIVNVLRRQRLLRDPEVMTSFRELSKKAQKAHNVWWRLSGLLGDQNRNLMYMLLQALFTVATMALTVPIFLSYRMHATFQILKVSASVWNGGNFLLDVMPRQVVLKEKKKEEMKPLSTETNSPPDDSQQPEDESCQLVASMCTENNTLQYSHVNGTRSPPTL